MEQRNGQYDGLHPAPPRPAGLEVNYPPYERLGAHSPQNSWGYNEPQYQYAQEKRRSEIPSEQPYKKKRICSMARTTFWLLVVITFLVIAIIVGVAVGVTLGEKSHSSATTITSSTPVPISTLPPTTTTVTVTSVSTASAPTSTTEQQLLDTCSNGTTYTAATGSTFMEYCGYDIGVGTSYGNNATDFTGIRIDSFHACMDFCAFNNALSLQWPGIAGSCHAVSWIVSGSGEFACWIKNGTGTPHAVQYHNSAVLLIN